MADSRRADRVAEAIRSEVATFLAEGAKDPRIRAFVTVTGVDVTRDLRQARVFVSLMGDDADRAATIEGLTNLAPHLRARIGKTLRLRSAPEVEFRIDESIARAARIDSLLAQARENDASISKGDERE
ncbi:MAG: 30S ribosome-binding factor RbfA [Gemmatimonadaceae bacterium]